MTMLTTNLLLSMFLTMMTLKSPAIMAINILILALLMSWMFSFFISSWYGYLIFLIYIGGMLIMFAYFVALSPNQQLKMKIYITTFLTTLTMTSIPSYTMPNKFIMVSHNSFQVNELYNTINIPMLYLMILLLLFIMLMVTKMIYTSKGPLRPFM
uniref:NADH dehydrogenase subunit 6 n=1 Tax=Haementeria officinalis TaxID=6410 RepID=A0A175D1G4_HAEOF|nr:NADH dehydrogenase subunit 6 [Haementeria officinalis]